MTLIVFFFFQFYYGPGFKTASHLSTHLFLTKKNDAGTVLCPFIEEKVEAQKG